ncbi:MAG: xanthine dehydrogenase family protein subunit M [Calditrichaeota bacterium]|nr:MAG: xanthine dehydrogenase family protein subunit M [Calditrichota bacterium]
MIPASFEYHRPGSLQEALQLLQTYGGEASVLAGGHSLLPSMKLRLARPGRIIDIGRLAELNYIREEGNAIAIGALTTHHEIATWDLVVNELPFLAEAAAAIGDVQVRNKGTIGGSLAHADPAADYPAAVLAGNAEIVVQGAGGSRKIAAADFFVDLFTTSLQPGELITEIRFPKLSGKTGSAYLKFPHPASRFAVVGCAAVVTVDGGTIQEARVALTGVASTAYRAKAVEDALKGQSTDPATVEQAVEKATEGVDVMSDHFASSEYRAHLARVYARRALLKAIERA